jgi:hypothetical protein
MHSPTQALLTQVPATLMKRGCSHGADDGNDHAAGRLTNQNRTAATGLKAPSVLAPPTQRRVRPKTACLGKEAEGLG